MQEVHGSACAVFERVSMKCQQTLFCTSRALMLFLGESLVKVKTASNTQQTRTTNKTQQETCKGEFNGETVTLL